jgi:DNA-binding MarR family transcriptional regulator/ribosomal protein S18 acetylase RimI-like enzyme
MEFLPNLGLLALASRLRALSERFYNVVDEVYQRSELPVEARSFALLRLLSERGAASVGEIASAIGQTHSAVSQMADRLVRQGVLETQSDSADQRRRQLRLSAITQQQLRLAKPLWRAIEETLAARGAAAKVDVLGALNGMDTMLDGQLAQDILATHQRHARAHLRIEAFTPERREHFLHLNAAWLRKYFYLEEIDHRILSNPEGEIIAQGGRVYFALLDDLVVGTCALKWESAGVYELSKMGVDAQFQGIGIGRKLLEHALDEFERLGGKELFLESSTKLLPALHLYESVGFVHQKNRRPDSHYARADVYMLWQGRGQKSA